MLNIFKSRDGKLTPTKSELTQQYSLEIGSRPISSQLLTSMGATSLFWSQLSTQARARWAGSWKIDYTFSNMYTNWGDSQSEKTSKWLNFDNFKRDLQTSLPDYNSKVHPIYLRSCRSDETTKFNMFKEKDLGFNSEMLKHNIIDSVSFFYIL